MKQCVVAVVCALGVSVAAQLVPPKPPVMAAAAEAQGPRGAEPLVLDDHAGFESIFDGTSLRGWDGDPAFWKAERGVIVGQSTEQNPVKQNTFLIWRGGEPADFELKVEFRMNSTNSGVQFRSSSFIGGPTCIWNPNRPASARFFVSSSMTMLVTAPFRIWTIVLPRATMCT
jgi:hypothetical protein